jgi:rhamnosyltransferase
MSELSINISRNEIIFNHLLLINNSPDVDLSEILSKKITLINNRGNIGLASAINKGLDYLKKHNYKMAVLLDQDTFLPKNFLNIMLHNINSFTYPRKIALFAPIFFNNVTNNFGSIINFKPFRLIKSRPQDYKTFSLPKYVITSGSFIPISVIDDLGMMLDELFIDFIDIEWCLRARKNGYEIVSFTNSKITHNLGDFSISFFGVNYPIHSPLRMYYFFRNSIYLYRLKEIDWNWRLIDGSRNLFRFLFYMIFVKNRWSYFRYILKGYYHGFKSKMGKLKE